MIAAEVSVHAPPLAWLTGVILFVVGTWVGSTWRALRPDRRPPRRWVQPRSDIDRSRQ